MKLYPVTLGVARYADSVSVYFVYTNYYDVISIRAELVNFAIDSKRSFFDVLEIQKVSLRSVDRQIQLYLDSLRAQILID